MIPYQGLLFFYGMGLLLLPAVLLGILEKPLKPYGLLFSVLMLLWVFWENGQLLQLAGFYLWQVGLCFFFWRSRKMPRLMIFLSLLPLVVVKVGEILPPLSFFGMLGVSYMTFRSMQVLLDIRDGHLKELSLSSLSYFLLFFPSVASGPIDRYRRFLGDLAHKPSREEYLALVRRGVWRLAFGAFFAIALSGVIWESWLSPLPDAGLLPTISYMYGYTFYLFFNFAGYSGMAIGTAYILGVSLPENFRMPFLSIDMKDFWSRWHISLSSWMRDYLYTRFVMASLKKNRFKSKRTASYLGNILTMAAMGAWHGLTPGYLLYGAYHGLLLCVNEALDQHWKPFKRLRQHSLAQAVMAFVTFHLFSFGLLIFSGRLV